MKLKRKTKTKIRKKTKQTFTVGIALGALCLTQVANAQEVRVYKLYNRVNQEFLYTTNKAEYETLSGSTQWEAMGEGYKVETTSKEGNVPVYRCYNAETAQHFLTQSKKEMKKVQAQGWKVEGVAFFSASKGKNPVYRLKNDIGSYRYPADEETKEALLAQGWESEGIAWYQDTVISQRFSHSGSQAMSDLPEGFEAITPLPEISTYSIEGYPWGQCTWYAYNRAKQLGINYSLSMGNGGDWQSAVGYEVTQTPQEGTVVSFSPGQAGADLGYGHVAFVEQVRSDGAILVSESNVQGLGVVSYRTFSAEEAKEFHYVVGK